MSSANGVIPFDPGLVTQSVNYHGHNLLKQLVSDNALQFHTIKLQDIDYKVYQSRNTELRNLGASRIQEIIGFIASKSDQLLVTQSQLRKPEECKESDYQDRYKHQLPFEYFLNVNKNIRVQEFMNAVEVGDILFAEVVNTFENTSFTSLKFIAYDGGKHRYLLDSKTTDLKLVLKNEDTSVPKADEDKIGRWMCGTRLRVEVLSIYTASTVPCLFVGTKGVTLESTSKEHIKLGKILIKDLPQILSVTPDPSIRYLSDCIEKMNSYKNPQCIREMASRVNIDLHWYPSLFNSISSNISESETAIALRKSQMCKWAHKNVADGVTYFKKGQHEEAFQCLNKALQIDKDNVEAFVAKGALLANLGRYEKAIEDFEKSLAFNPDHVNARKYMCETLVELGKQKEEQDKLKEAEKCYSRCLELNEHHAVAREALNDVSRKLGPESNLMKLIKLEATKSEEEFLADLIQIEQELNKKRDLEENPIPTITTNTSKLEKAHPLSEVIIVEDEEEEESPVSEEGDLSPLSKKLANQETLWTRPSSDSNMPIASFIQPVVPPTNRLDMNMFSNPPPNWPLHTNLSQPPPVLMQPKLSGGGAPNYEDQNYNARVEEFLKELENRSLGGKQRTSSGSVGKEVKTTKDEKREKERRNRSSSSSSSGSSNSSDDSNRKIKKRRSSSSGSDSSSSSSSSSSSGSTSKSKKKSSKKSRKLKSKKKKKSAKKKKEKEVNEKEVKVETSVPDFGDLEEKLMAYYKKMEAMNTAMDDSSSSSSGKSSTSRSRSSSLEKTNKAKKSSSKKELKKKKTERMEVKSTKNPLANKLKLITHPAFLDDESEEEKAPKNAKLPRNSAPSRPQQESKPVAKSKKSFPSPVMNKRRSTRTFSRSRSRSRGRTSSSRPRSRRSRSYSRGRSKSRSPRRRRSRSRSPRYRQRYSRSRSRSRSRAKYQGRSESKEKFGYYRNKPFFGNNKIAFNKNPQDTQRTPPPPVKFELKRKPDPKMVNVVEDAKRKIYQHLASNAREFNTHMKKIEDKIDGERSKASLNPSSRFGKWANEDGSKDTGSKSLGPEGSLAQFENFLKLGKEKNKELMKERNKAFLKPNIE